MGCSFESASVSACLTCVVRVACVQVDSITIPVGPRLGDKVVEVSGLSKGFGDRLLVEGASFSVPPGKAIRAEGSVGASVLAGFRAARGARVIESAAGGSGGDRRRKLGDSCLIKLYFYTKSCVSS